MKDLRRMRERFIRDRSPVRMGNLASDLLRLSKWIQERHNDKAIVDLMRQIAWLMEWCGDLASAELADMQREICRWRRAWPVEQARSILAFRAVQMSNRILEWSGLLEEGTFKFPREEKPGVSRKLSGNTGKVKDKGPTPKLT